MENWLYNIKHWWAHHGRNVKRYGFCALIIIAGARKDDWITAWCGLFLAVAFYGYDRYDGAYWQQRGQQVLYPSKFPKKDAPPPPPKS
jgi:hypothetical protein